MRSIVKIAIGTAVGILLAGVVALVVVLVLFGAPFTSGERGSNTTADAASAPTSSDDSGERSRSSSSRSYTRAVKPKKARSSSRVAAALVSCDANISVKPKSTTCAFAQNAFFSYWVEYDSPGSLADSSGYPVYSAALGRMLTLNCSGTEEIVCQGGDGAYVKFSASAVRAYTRSNAERYLSYADTGGIEPAGSGRGVASEPDEAVSEGDEEGYGGDSPDIGYDLDCADFDGPVNVSPDDPHDLDRDGDGVGCDA